MNHHTCSVVIALSIEIIIVPGMGMDNIAGTFTKPCYFHTRMRYVYLFTILSFTASGQALRDINYNFRYNPSEPLEFQAHAVRGSGNWTAYYTLIIRDSAEDVSQFSIQWEIRKDLSEKEGL